MISFCKQYGKRNPTTSAVRSRLIESGNGLCSVLEFAFSDEVVQKMEWKKGELLDVSQNGGQLVLKRYRQGRKLIGKPLVVRFSFPKSNLKTMQESFGFDVSVSNFWEIFDANAGDLILKLTDVNIPND